MPPDEIISIFLAEVKRVYGEEVAQKTRLWYGRGGWFYLAYPVVNKRGKLVATHFSRTMRRTEILAELEKLRQMPPPKSPS